MATRRNRVPASTIAGSRLTKSVSRDILKGGEGRVRRRRRPPDFRPLFGRLRRLELAMVYQVSGKPRDFDMDRYVQDVIQREKDAETQSGRNNDQGGALQLPQEGSPSREAEGKNRADSGPSGWLDDEIPYQEAPEAPEDT